MTVNNKSLDDFIKRIQKAEISNSKEIILSIKEARLLSSSLVQLLNELNESLKRNNDQQNEFISYMKKKEEEPIQIKIQNTFSKDKK